MYTDDHYQVEITPAAQRRYIKKLKKKHKSHWEVTLTSLKEETKRIEALLRTDKAEILHSVDGHRLIKIYFRIAGSKQSARASGYRCIVYLENRIRIAKILLAYSKNELGPPNETSKIRAQIKSDHPELASIFGLK